MAFDTPETILSPTGAKVNLHSVAPEESPVAAVQINHGLAEHSARYSRFAKYLAERGFAVFAHDHRGHGHTSAPGAPLGSFGPGGVDTVLDDVLAVHEHIAQAYPGLPVIVFGHSMGALIALNFVSRYPRRVAGAAIWNGNFTGGVLALAAKAVLAWEKFRLGSDVPSRILPRLTFRDWARRVSDGRTEFDWLSHDHNEVDRYVADPFCGWAPSIGMWNAVFDMMIAGSDDRILARIPRDLPINLVGGDQDPATDFGKAVTRLEDRMRRTGFLNLTSTIYEKRRHESLNELNQNIIMKKFADWAEMVATNAGTTPSA